MHLYCKTVDGVSVVVATHTEDQDVPASAYGDGVTIQRYTGDTPVAELLMAKAPPAEPPASVSRAQARIALFHAGLLDQVKVLADEAGGETALWFEEAGRWERSNPHVAALGAELKLTPAQIDDLFVQAGQIVA